MDSIKTAIILAGGMGSRLQSVVSSVPKPMAPINGKPFLSFLFDFLIDNDIEKIVLSVGYKHEVISSYYGYNYKSLKIIYSIEEEKLDTGGAIVEALKYVDNYCFVLNGDTFFEINLQELLTYSCDVVLALKPLKDFERYGNVILDDDNKILKFEEKKYMVEGNINGGVYLLNKNLFNNFDIPKIFSFESFLSENVHKIRAKGIVFDKNFIDIGIPSDYKLAQSFFEKDKN